MQESNPLLRFAEKVIKDFDEEVKKKMDKEMKKWEKTIFKKD